MSYDQIQKGLTAGNTNGESNGSFKPPKRKFEQGLQNNFFWSQSITHTNPDFFSDLAKEQKPQILWFGCSDSRVPETTVMQLQPGDVFVHRSIANQIVPGEASAGSVLHYATEHLHDKATGEAVVKDIVVCGHANCGGCIAALAPTTDNGGPIDAWLAPLRALSAQLEPQWNAAGLDQDARVLELVKANVWAGVAQVLADAHVAQEINDGKLSVHAVLYDLKTGLLTELDPVQ